MPVLKDTTYDLYISYHSAQKTKVDYCCKLFRNANLKLFCDKDLNNLPNKFEQNLTKLQSSFIFVCFLSKEYQKCIKNRIEFSVAVEQNVKIIKFYFDDHLHIETGSQKQNLVDINLNTLNVHSFNLLAKAIKNEIEQNYCSLLVKQKEDEISEIFKNFKKSYQKVISVCNGPDF